MSEADNVFRAKEKEYGASYREHLMAQYQLYVENMEKISDILLDCSKIYLNPGTLEPCTQ